MTSKVNGFFFFFAINIFLDVHPGEKWSPITPSSFHNIIITSKLCSICAGNLRFCKFILQPPVQHSPRTPAFPGFLCILMWHSLYNRKHISHASFRTMSDICDIKSINVNVGIKCQFSFRYFLLYSHSRLFPRIIIWYMGQLSTKQKARAKLR